MRKTVGDKFRMAQWLLLSMLVYAVAAALAAHAGETDAGLYPRAQTVLWKVGHLNLAAFLGYWFDRNAFRLRIDCASPALEHIRRAIIMAATIIAMALAI